MYRKESFAGYPHSISEYWTGIPNDIDDAVQWSNGKSYFFKDGNYLRYDDEADTVRTAIT
jgi:hypothetical protein